MFFFYFTASILSFSTLTKPEHQNTIIQTKEPLKHHKPNQTVLSYTTFINPKSQNATLTKQESSNDTSKTKEQPSLWENMFTINVNYDDNVQKNKKKISWLPNPPIKKYWLQCLQTRINSKYQNITWSYCIVGDV